ncbi:response regulator transcription factor [Achromobacter sp. F4_2707]|uniref:response regulator transcription factor n=1 Tax=Achromobacter sp. F4_2707 TaxID=3114286 RepID=UPI0039C6B627
MHIASVEDDAAQGELLRSIVTKAGYECTVYTTGREFLAALAKPHPYNLLLIDWELPDITGFEVLRWVRSNLGQNLPIIFVTNRSDESDLVAALHAGADDYVIKPPREAELLARIRTLSRRSASLPVQDAPFQCAAYYVEPDNNRIELRGRKIELAPKEFELALLFLRNPGHLFSRDVLSSSVWNRDIPATSRTIDTHLSNIRRKLHLKPENGVRLTASYALGYRLELLNDDESPAHAAI